MTEIVLRNSKNEVIFRGPAHRHGPVLALDQLKALHKLPLTPLGKEFILHDYQNEDIQLCLPHDRVGLFLPVGAGKTVVGTLIALGWDNDKRIVLVPPVLIPQWVRWLNSIPSSRGAVAYAGTPKQRSQVPLDKASWWVMSYQIFKNDFEALADHLDGLSLAILADEAQNLKNVTTANYKTVRDFSAGQNLILMTGTELNSPMDAYAYIKLKTPSIYRTKSQFESIHVGGTDFFGAVTKWNRLDLMNKNLYLHSAHRTKEEVHAHLPKANYIPIRYELDPKHLALYEQLAEEQLLELESGGKIDATTSGALYANLQQIIVNWSHFSENPNDVPAIFTLIDTVCEEIDLGRMAQPANPRTGAPAVPAASKLIIWTWYKRSTEAVLAHMLKRYPGRVVAAYSGANSDKSIARFMDDPECIALVAQPGSAGAGLNPQYICWETLFVETPTRTIPFRQAAGRIDREGQQFNPNIRIAIAEGTLQNRLHNNLLVNDALVSQVQGGITDLRSAIYGR